MRLARFPFVYEALAMRGKVRLSTSNSYAVSIPGSSASTAFIAAPIDVTP